MKYLIHCLYQRPSDGAARESYTSQVFAFYSHGLTLHVVQLSTSDSYIYSHVSSVSSIFTNHLIYLPTATLHRSISQCHQPPTDNALISPPSPPRSVLLAFLINPRRKTPWAPTSGLSARPRSAPWHAIACSNSQTRRSSGTSLNAAIASQIVAAPHPRMQGLVCEMLPQLLVCKMLPQLLVCEMLPQLLVCEMLPQLFAWRYGTTVGWE